MRLDRDQRQILESRFLSKTRRNFRKKRRLYRKIVANSRQARCSLECLQHLLRIQKALVMFCRFHVNTTTDAKRLKGMPGPLVAQYQRLLRFHGVDIMSSTGGVVSASHTQDDIAQATSAFKATVHALLQEKLVHTL